ncbi:carbamoyltransferase HypF [Clostridium gasigenes]|uniref:carbamoyltransferase HypF n=1 Tax=Clostridium gasigenes TaxID=94869 RepID=UPI001625DBCC|nr:carbamoyltransferase HypF [Clostridium gasigenes]MBB6622344.1 carbamoyltransferase HypF [Clostridium gasigenes]
MIRKYIVVKGIVQGVGFRPFIYKIALNNKLNGWVKNSCEGVYIDIEGPPKDISNFIMDLKRKAPMLSKIEYITIIEKELKGYKDFKILISDISEKDRKDEYKDENELEECSKGISTIISPDIATCEDCRNEVLDKSNLRRGGYSFTNCTNCGPRFTIIKKLPYDRFQTTMNEFNMCSQCISEYENPLNRRFHAEPTCCNRCGPKLIILDNRRNVIDCIDKLKKIREYLKEGKIIAVKGLGGFNLICNGKDKESIDLLRKRKRRKTKPLALMMRNIDVTLKYCNINSKENEILIGNKKPIVLLEKKDNQLENNKTINNEAIDQTLGKIVNNELLNYKLPNNISFNSSKLGVVLPYTPLHYLLFDEELEVLVFTSANISGAPMIYENEKALSELKDVADYFLIHNRDINIPIDDSVVNVILNEERVIRGGRGYAPISKKYIVNDGILALGSQFKNTLSISSNKYIFTSPYIGEMDNLETLSNFENNMNYIKNIYNINIKTICYDMHPNYWSSEFVKNYKCEKIGVYHHHAHIVSCMVDNNITSRVIGLAFDGTGYGEDGEIWGSEFLICDFKRFKRVGHLSYMDMPTGDGAVMFPWKMGASLIYKSLKENNELNDKAKDIVAKEAKEVLEEKLNKEIPNIIKFLPSQFSYKNFNLIMKIIDNKINTPLTSSMGRLFDGVASLLGFNSKISYEGEAAIYLQNLAESFIKERSNNIYEKFYSYDLAISDDMKIINTNKIIKNILEDLKNQVNKGEIAIRFHNTIVEISSNICISLRDRYGINEVALSGGVFQNEILLEKLYLKLKENDFNVLTHKNIPCNDSGISVGQLVIANEQRN